MLLFCCPQVFPVFLLLLVLTFHSILGVYPMIKSNGVFLVVAFGI